MQVSIDEVRDDVRDRELSRLIERRAESNPDPDEQEEIWRRACGPTMPVGARR